MGSRPGTVSGFPCWGTPISGGRIQKRPLTHPGRDLADSAPSLLRLTGKGLTPRSSLSFSRSTFYSADTRRLSASGGSVLPPPGSRRQRALPEPVELFTRLVTIKRDCGPWSRRGINRAPCSRRTRFEPDGSAEFHGRVIPARPHSCPLSRAHYEIESGDYSSIGEIGGLLPEASLERGEPVSWHHALRDANLTAGEDRPLRRMVSSVWRVFVPISMTSKNALALP